MSGDSRIGGDALWRLPLPHRRRVDIVLVEVVVLGRRTVYQRTEYQVEPVAGTGVTWVQESSLTFKGENDRQKYWDDWDDD